MVTKEQWKRIQYICRVVRKGGPLTILHLAADTIKSFRSDQWKYQYWRKKHEKPVREEETNKTETFFSVVLLGKGEETYSRESLNQLFYSTYEIVNTKKDFVWKDVLSKAKGEYLVLLCRGDKLARNALQKLSDLIEKNPDSMLWYSDEDRITEQGDRKQPFFKPDYSPDTLRSFFYMGGVLVLKKELLAKLPVNLHAQLLYGGYLLALEASLVLKREQIYHIPEVLYHRQEVFEKPNYVQMSKDKETLLRQYGMEVKTEKVKQCGESRILYELKEKPKVSIIIPSKDHPQLLQLCLDSIRQYTQYENYEILVIDNGSNPKNQAYYERLCESQNVSSSYYYEPMEFNFSRMCNIGAQKASGDFYLFLNDDIEIQKIKDYDWLERMLGQAMQKHTGAVGAKLLYPSSNRIQHVGVVNYESGAAHILGKCKDDKPLLFGRNRFDYNYSIVTGACFLISKKKFQQAGGFSEELAVTFNDVELCFKLLENGYYNVIRNDVVLFHHESISRGADTADPIKFAKHLRERERLFALHPAFVKKDCFYSKNMTQKRLDGSVNIDKPKQYFEPFSEGRKIGTIRETNQQIDAIIEYAQIEGDLVMVRGFAYAKHIKYNNLNRTYLVLKGKKDVKYVETQKLYNHTISVQRGTNQNLNFVEFHTIFPSRSLIETHYRLGILLKPFAKSTAYMYITDTCLEKGIES